MQIFSWAVPALLLAVLAVTVTSCGGGSNGNSPANADVFPTATLPRNIPQPIIVSGTPQAPSAGQRYTVKSGDNPASIAARFGVSLDELLSVNNITDPTALRVGQQLTIPGGGSATSTPGAQPTAARSTPPEQPTTQPTARATSTSGGRTYTVQAGDNPASIAAQFGITAQQLMAANSITDPSSLQIGQVLTIPSQ